MWGQMWEVVFCLVSEGFFWFDFKKAEIKDIETCQDISGR